MSEESFAQMLDNEEWKEIRKCIKAAHSSEKHIGDLPGGVGLFDEWNQIGGTEMGDRPFTYFKI